MEIGRVRRPLVLNWARVRAVLFLCLLFSFCPAAFAGNVITVYFVPFQIETYIGITTETIASRAWEKWTVSDAAEAHRLLVLLSPGRKQEFHQGRVRSLVLSNGQTYFIDAEGAVLRGKEGMILGGELGFRIDKEQFINFRNSLRSDQRQILKRGE